jgi:hypothetical protein
MSDGFKRLFAPAVLALVLVLQPLSMRAEDAAWTVSRSSGEAWLTVSGAQPAALSEQASLRPGDGIRTGHNGRVLLTRGEETILVAPNSAISLPRETKDGLSTTILQQAGSILLRVEKRNENHFSVETPYLAAVVKGTQFTITVTKTDSRVGVVSGKVEVSDFKSGQHAFVLPGQMAKVSTSGPGGLSLSGSGTLSPVLPGEPRKPSIEPLSKGGLSTAAVTAGGTIRIAQPLGPLNLDVGKATKGLAHLTGDNGSSGRGDKRDASSVDLGSGGNATQDGGNGNGNSAGNAGGGGGGPVASVLGGNGGGGNSGGGGLGSILGNAFGHSSCNAKGKGKSGC